MAPEPKRIIICCDGTWQDSASGKKNSPSNSTRLARCLNRTGEQDGKTYQQIVWYDSGIGTESNLVANFSEGYVGAGMEGKIIEAYNFVVLNWSPGDQIFCFGFSRGAYTARSIAGLITDIGICEPRLLQDFYEIWDAYKANDSGEPFSGSDQYFGYVDGVPADDKDQPEKLGYRNSGFVWKKHPHGDWATTPESREIEVVGVYDTVGALGLPDFHGYKLSWGPDKNGYHNVKLNPNIKRAFQALALDEHREAYSPTLWHLPKADRGKRTKEELAQEEEKKQSRLEDQRRLVAETQAAWAAKADDKKVPMAERKTLKLAYNKARRDLMRMEENMKEPSKLLQVWFPGMHINIGGGSTNTKGDLEEMSNITFMWMLQQIRPYLSINEYTVYQQARMRQNTIDDLNEQVRKFEEKKALDEEEAKRSWARWATYNLSAISHLGKPDPSRRDFGWGTGTFVDSYSLASRVLNGSKLRTPGAYEKDPKYTAPGDTHEEIHPTTGYRVKMLKKKGAKVEYYPAGVTESMGYQRRPRTDGTKGWEYVLAHGVVLSEYKIKPEVDDGRGGGEDTPNFERFAVALGGEHATPYLEDLDKENGF